MGQGHEIEMAYRTNTAGDAVRRFTVSTTWVNDNEYQPSFTEDGFYSPGELTKIITYDENHEGSTKNHSTEEYTDLEGRVVLKRTFADLNGQAQVPHDTYYLYDEFGNLTYVFPPKVTVPVSGPEMEALCYQYKYDHRNRLIEKQLPGKGREYIVYNAQDQPIMTQDANLELSDTWLFTKYDALGRVAYTGKAVDSRSRSQIQSEVDLQTQDPWVNRSTGHLIANDSIYYENASYPTTNITELLTINYYDDYQFNRAGAPSSVSSYSIANESNNSGLATGTKVKVLDVTPSQWITTVTYYDYKARPIYTYSHNAFLETVDIVESELDFAGKPLRIRTQHSRNGSTLVLLDFFTYDHVGRLEGQSQCIGDETMGYTCQGSTSTTNPVLSNTIQTSEVKEAKSSITLTYGFEVVAASDLTFEAKINPSLPDQGEVPHEQLVLNQYNELGQLNNKQVGGRVGQGGLQTVNYTYNIRGWLSAINNVNNLGDDLFAFGIGYNSGNDPLYNGNISRTQWRTQNEDSSLKHYTYTYDALNRITSATDNTGKYTVTNITYDPMGNIRTLSRNGWQNSPTHFTNMDVLDYGYDIGNRLLKVDDAGSSAYGFQDGTNTGDDYTYDLNGNLTSDANKGITSISYNLLNLPTGVTVSGSGHSGSLGYTYDATGIKLRKTLNESGTTTDYAGNYIYENGILQFVFHPEGYALPDGQGGYDYVYQYKDHLGNVRLSYTDADGNGSIAVTPNPATTELIEENHYYPFGLQHKGYNNVINGTENNYQTYNGKEFTSVQNAKNRAIKKGALP